MIPYVEFTSIDLGIFKIQTWGLMVALGFLAALFITLKEAKRKGIDSDVIYNLAILIFLGTFIGGRLLYVILFWQEFSGNLVEILKVWKGGLVFYGGILGAILFGFIYIKVKKLNFWKLADTIAPGIGLGIFFGRIGCSLINDHPGSQTGLPWGIVWPDGIIRHPVAEYLSLGGLIIFLILWSIRKKVKKEGVLFNIFIIYYSVSRFLLDFTRTTDISLPNADPHFYGLTISQYISILLLIFSSIWFIREFLLKSNGNLKSRNSGE